MTEQNQGGKNLPAIPDKIIVAPIANDASLLAKAGFTDRLPVVMRDLNYILGRVNVGGKLEAEPEVLSYDLQTNANSPTLARNVEYSSGPKVSLRVFPQEWYPIRQPDGKFIRGERAVLEIKDGIGHDGSITSAFLTDLQDLLRATFPGRKVTLRTAEREEEIGEVEGKPVYSREVKDLDFYSLTEESLNELPEFTRSKMALKQEPYQIAVGDNQGRSLVFLSTGLEAMMVQYKGEFVSELDLDQKGLVWIKQKRTFSIYQLSYDTLPFWTSGKEIEELLERFRQLAANNPYFHITSAHEERWKEEGIQ